MNDIDKRTGRPYGDHGTALQAIQFATNWQLCQETDEFLKGWLEGDLDEWPEFYEWLTKQPFEAALSTDAEPVTTASTVAVWAMTDLEKGRYYESVHFGLVEYLGRDVFHGQTTAKFETGRRDICRFQYVLPEKLGEFLGTKTTDLTAKVQDVAGREEIGPSETALRNAVEPFLDWLEQREAGAHIAEVREGLIGVEDVIPDDHVVLGAHLRAQKDDGVLTIGHFRRLQSAYDGNLPASPASKPEEPAP